MAKMMILGAGGQLGRELSKIFPSAVKVFHKETAGSNNLDLSNPGRVEKFILDAKPDVVINAAALANVDLCEKDHSLAYKVNGSSVGAMASACRKLGSILVHVSTDYVFDGKDGNYSEQAIPNPINYYGFSKIVGDIHAISYEKTMVVRTSGVFGHTMNFPLFVLDRLMKKEEVNAIEGYYSPIHAANLARAISILLKSDWYGLINVAGERVSRYKLALDIAVAFGLDKSLVHETKNLQKLNAKRPFDSSLDSTKAKEMIGFDFFTIQANLNAMKHALG